MDHCVGKRNSHALAELLGQAVGSRILDVKRSAPSHFFIIGQARRIYSTDAGLRQPAMRPVTIPVHMYNRYNRISRLRHVALAAILCTVRLGPAGAQFGPPPPKPTGPWMNKSLSPDRRADLILVQMTLDEKVSLLHGGGWQMLFAGPDAPPSKSLGNAGYIPGIPRLGIPDLQMADAAVGVTHSAAFGRYSTALPSCLAEAARWDLDVRAHTARASASSCATRATTCRWTAASTWRASRATAASSNTRVKIRSWPASSRVLK